MASDDRIKVAVLVEAGGDERERDALTAKLRRELLRLNVDAVAAASRRSRAARSGKTSTIASVGSCWRCRRFGSKTRTSPASGRLLPRAAQRAPRGGRARRHATGPPAAAPASMARQRAGAGDDSGAGGNFQAGRMDHVGRPRSAGPATSETMAARPCRAPRCGRGESGAWLAAARGASPRIVAKCGAATSSRTVASPTKSARRALRGPCPSSAAPPVPAFGGCSVCPPWSYWLTVMSDVAEWLAALVWGRDRVTVRRGRGNLEPSRAMPRLDIVSYAATAHVKRASLPQGGRMDSPVRARGTARRVRGRTVPPVVHAQAPPWSRTSRS